MKQGKLFKSFLLLGMAVLLFAVSSCANPNNSSEDKTESVVITKVTIKDQVFDVSTTKTISLPNGVDSFTANDVKNVKGKVKGQGAEIDLALDKIDPTPVQPTVQGANFTLYTKATKEYKAGKITLVASKETKQSKAFAVNFEVTPSNAAKITATVEGKPIDSGNTVSENAIVTFELTLLKQTFKEVEWKGPTNLVVDTNKMKATLTVKEITNITVTLKEDQQAPKGTDVTVNWEVEGDDSDKHGKMAVFKDSNPLSKDTKVKVGEKLTALASPATGYDVESWKINGVVRQNETRKFFTVEVSDEHVTNGLKITVKYKAKAK
ncbi:MAG: hypothetical protein ACTTIZ_02515 [Treponema sp.]